MFKMIDADGSGTITFEELKQSLKRVGSDLMESEIQDLMNAMEKEENLIAAFAYFDKDGSGYITIDELQLACKDFGLGEASLEETIKEIDTDHKGNKGIGIRGNLNFSVADSLGSSDNEKEQ
nr:calcium-dependent protein kinase 11-like [Ipomoea batatas]GMD66478.1 calcium-dependent protein kinase 11-like [Ipomoea batatas]